MAQRKLSRSYALLACSLVAATQLAHASTMMSDVEVTQLGTYHGASAHFVWFSAAHPECLQANPVTPVLSFDDTRAGGQALFSTLTTALVSKRKVDVRANGCVIEEVYLK